MFVSWIMNLLFVHFFRSTGSSKTRRFVGDSYGERLRIIKVRFGVSKMPH